MHRHTQRFRRLVRERHPSHVGKLPQCRNLLTSLSQFRVAVTTVDVQHRDAPSVSPLGVELHTVFGLRKHLGEGNGDKARPSLAYRPLIYLHAESPTRARCRQRARIETGKVKATTLFRRKKLG